MSECDVFLNFDTPSFCENDIFSYNKCAIAGYARLKAWMTTFFYFLKTIGAKIYMHWLLIATEKV